MPLGFFGSNSGKAQQLVDGSSKEKKDKKDDIKDKVLKLSNTVVTIEKKLSEGGFAIVYLVVDRKNRHFALKRQFTDDSKQVEACMQECKIVSLLKDHKNIVGYVDHLITKNKNGIYDCMLLTVYYKKSVLQLMNERLSNNLGLSIGEILNIFCDMCEAVARLHLSKSPVIHRDLKVENILIDERNRGQPPTYVLCDFGSATTKVMSSETMPIQELQAEIERNTTLSYRAPEMIDLYAGKPIGTKSDIWAMGVMLYKLCYFKMPFGESAMAIQNGSYSFPTSPDYPPCVRAIIHALLEADIEKRLSIYACASVSFEAMERKCTIENVYRIQPPKLADLIVAHAKNEKKEKILREEDQLQPQQSQQSCAPSTSTSVNPRLRPKATSSVPVVPLIAAGSPQVQRARPQAIMVTGNTIGPPPRELRLSSCGEVQTLKEPVDLEPPLSCPLIQPADLGFKDLGLLLGNTRSRGITDVTVTKSIQDVTLPQLQHKRNASDTSQIVKSAFKPYSQANETTSTVSVNEGTDWNPFTAAPFTANFESQKAGTSEDDTSSIDSRDPFGAAPFEPPVIKKSPTPLNPPVQGAADGSRDGNEVDGKRQQQEEEDSELDEQRMSARRRLSYENMDGVGDDASSDSRGRTDREEDSETDYTSRNGDTSYDEEGESSQQTDIVGSDDGGGQPLLDEDSGDDDDESYYGHVAVSEPLYIDAKQTVNITQHHPTNPFLQMAPDDTPKMMSPAAPIPKFATKWDDEEESSDENDRLRHRRDTFYERPVRTDGTVFAPATLPRQSTPLTAVQKTKPDLPSAAPICIVPSMSTNSFHTVLSDIETPQEPVVGTLIQMAEPEPEKPVPPPHRRTIPDVPPAAPKEPLATFALNFPPPKAGKYQKKSGKKGKKVEASSDGSDLETDGSEVEMCATSNQSDRLASGKKKKKTSAFSLRSSNPSIITTDLMTPITTNPKKTSKDKKHTSTGALNASFVNSSFQAEDADPDADF